MSGPICPDCSLLALEEAGKSKMKCPICGWKGEMPPRKIMGASMGNRLWDETKEKLQLREAGKLFYYRIYLKGTEDQKSDALFDIMDILDLDTVDGSDMLFFHVREKLSEEQLKEVKALKAVRKIKVF